MQLIDYFQTFTLINFTIFGVFLLLMDFLGYSIAKILKITTVFRPVYWLIGFALFSFEWFVLHFFMPFRPSLVWLSLIPLVTFAIFTVRKYSLKQFSLFWKEGLVLLFLLVPFAKALFFHTALPPRLWDEMAYHFYSPMRVDKEVSWNFSHPLQSGEFDFYMMLPRTIDVMYILIFSITHTYATAQLLHLLIVLSSILVVSKFFSEKGGLLPAVVFQFLFLFLNTELLFDATTGYIDSATAAIVILPLVALFLYVQKPTAKNLMTTVLLSSLSMGTKYTALSFLASSWLIALLLVLLTNSKIIDQVIKNKKKILLVSLNTLGVLLVVSVLFGGYWYLKNMIMTGNPTHPFTFFCQACSLGTAKLQGWGYLDFSVENIVEIFYPLFHLFRDLVFLFFLSIVLLFYFSWKNKTKDWQLLILAAGGVLLEVLLVSRVGNYATRFFYHWFILTSFIFSLPFLFFKQKNAKDILIIFGLFLSAVVFLFF